MLRAKITAITGAITVLAILVTAASVYPAVGRLVNDQLDRSLVDRVATVRTLLGTGDTPQAPLPERPDMSEQLVRPDGTVRPLGTGDIPLPVTEADLAIARAGSGSAQRQVTINGKSFDIITFGRPNGSALMVGQDYQESVHLDEAFTWQLWLAIAAAIVTSTLLSWLALGRILRPIRRLTTATEHITSTQALADPLPEVGQDEVGRLTHSFNSMLTALRLSREQQQRLVQDASHELRTPLTAILGSAELLRRARGRLEPHDEQQVLDTLIAEATALDGLSRELVELATDRRAEEEPETVDLPSAAEDSAQRFRHRTGRPITVTAHRPQAVVARPRALQRCIDNLVGNAVKFSPADTPVDIHVRENQLSVLDRGPGIDLAERASIFDRFYRSTNAQAIPGSGLGLAIVHDVITSEEGTVFAGNHRDGGAEIGFRLPAARRARR